MKDEDLIEGKDKLASGTAVKSKTFEVMEECGEWSDDPVSTIPRAVCVNVDKNKSCLLGGMQNVCVHALGLLVFPLHIK